jgi:hypothetical protein
LPLRTIYSLKKAVNRPSVETTRKLRNGRENGLKPGICNAH